MDEFSKLARYAPDDVATDVAKQEKFMEGLNDEMSMQLMVATFNNYQELVDKALMIEGKQKQIESRKRKYGQGRYNSGAQRNPVSPRNREDLFITMEATPIMEEVTIIILAQGTGMGMEQATIRTAPIQCHAQDATLS